jgi:GNAT superfamily N-acetyltransferase
VNPVAARIVPLADLPALVDVLAERHHAEWGALMPGWSHAHARAELTDHANRRRVPTTLVAVDVDGEPLGSVSVVDEDAPEFADRSPWLASLYVWPRARRRGLGARLVEAAVELAAACGVPRLHLFTPDHRAWYEALGWQWSARRPLGAVDVDLMWIAPTRVRSAP